MAWVASQWKTKGMLKKILIVSLCLYYVSGLEVNFEV